MQTLALVAQKGGTGKTTLAIALAVAAAAAGRKVLVLDVGPQGPACNWGDRREGDNPIVLDAQPGRLPAALQKAEAGGIDFVIIDTPARSEPASLAAATLAFISIIHFR